MEYVSGKEPVTIDAKAIVTEKVEQPREKGRFAKREKAPETE